MTRIAIYDTTLRDGSQGEGINFSLQDKLLITSRLDALGIDYVEGGYPLSNPKDEAFFRELKNLDLRHTKVAAFGMTRRRDLSAESDPGMQALVNSRAPVITIVGKSWDLHATEVLGISLEENIKMIADSVAFCAAAHHQPEIVYDAEHFFDGYRANPDHALATIQGAAKAGASWIVLCDTNGGSLPDWVAEATRAARSVTDVPIGIHTHNDGDLAVANTLAAIQVGATQVQGTINGIGERCGNVDLISVIANLGLKYSGFKLLNPDSLGHLTEVSRYVYELANLNYRNGQPFVGASAFAHKGGMHVHGIRKVVHSYEHIDPALVGNERRVLVSELSGRSNIAEKLAERGLNQDRELMTRILDRVQDFENEGYQFEAAEATFMRLVDQEAGLYRPWFERLHYHVGVESRNDGAPETEATVKLKIRDTIEHTVSEGDGPVNALDGALRKALEAHFPGLQEMSLVDYKVRVINAKAGTAARVRVVIESRDQEDVWGTVGVSENVIEASWLALLDSFEHKLTKDARRSDRPSPRSSTEPVTA